MKKENKYLEKLQPLIQFGFKNAEIEYSGSGDSGSVEDVTIEYVKRSVENDRGEEFKEILSQMCYDELAIHYSGWEINDGADGIFHVEFDGRNIEYWLDHSQHYMESEETSTDRIILDVAKI